MGKGTYYSYKVGYDPQYASFGPGHLLRRFLLEELCGEAGMKQVDFYGPLNEALACWATGRYPLGQLVVAAAGRPPAAAGDSGLSRAAPPAARDGLNLGGRGIELLYGTANVD